VTISTLAVALVAPFAGLVSDRWGRKRIIVLSTLLLALPTLLAATSANFADLVFWRFCQGFLTPGVSAVTVVYINEEWLTGTGMAMSAYVSGTVLGGFVGRSLAAVAAAHFAGNGHLSCWVHSMYWALSRSGDGSRRSVK
jgi:MFS family permease